MKRPSPHELFAEVARLAHRLHWPLDTLLDLEHGDRRRFLAVSSWADADASSGVARWEGAP